MYNVYINERLVRLVGPQEKFSGADIVLKLKGDESKEKLRILVQSFEDNPLASTMVIQSEQIDDTWKTFTSLYTTLEAAGGVVLNQYGQLLMIFRHGKWDLPKGKIEKGEEPDAAAVREVFEECGVGDLKLSRQLETTYHTYSFNEHNILKRTYWFLMSTTDDSTPVPQGEEHILAAEWKSKVQVEKALENSFASIAALLRGTELENRDGLLG